MAERSPAIPDHRQIHPAREQPFTWWHVPRRYRGAILNWSDPPRIWISLAAVPRLQRLKAINISTIVRCAGC